MLPYDLVARTILKSEDYSRLKTKFERVMTQALCCFDTENASWNSKAEVLITLCFQLFE